MAAPRESLTHLDGTRIFRRPEDAANEDAAARRLEKAWRCQIISLGAMHPIDFAALRYGRIVGLAELKCRNHTHGTYPTVFMPLRKYTHLLISGFALEVPAFFVVEFIPQSGNLFSVDISAVDARKHRLISGHEDDRDRPAELTIDVPIELFEPVADPGPAIEREGQL